MPLLAPPFTPLEQVDQRLRERGFAVLDAAGLAQLVETAPWQLDDWRAFWNDLPPDHYLRDGGRYRRRRHACFLVEGSGVSRVPQRAHWQPVEYNALHGGMQRMFAPMSDATVALPVWHQLVEQLAALSSALFDPAPVPGPCYVEAHQFRIDTAQGIGRPTPEGAHRDGVDLVAVFLVNRAHIKGGETRVFEANGPAGQRFTLTEPWSLMLMDDARMIHESTPIQPLQDGGVRDTLVVTCRRGEFQGDKELQSVQD